MYPTDTDILHYHLATVIPPYRNLLMLEQVDNIFMKFSLSILVLLCWLKLSIWRLKVNLEKRILFALMPKTIGQVMLAQLATNFLISVKLTILFLTFLNVIRNPIFQALKVNELYRPWTIAQANQRISLCVWALKTKPATIRFTMVGVHAFCVYLWWVNLHDIILCYFVRGAFVVGIDHFLKLSFDLTDFENISDLQRVRLPRLYDPP